MLFFDTRMMFSPIYDNGVSLGFRFDNEKLMEIFSDTKF